MPSYQAAQAAWQVVPAAACGPVHSPGPMRVTNACRVERRAGVRSFQQGSPLGGVEAEGLGQHDQRVRMRPLPLITLERRESGSAQPGALRQRLLAQPGAFAELPELGPERVRRPGLNASRASVRAPTLCPHPRQSSSRSLMPTGPERGKTRGNEGETAGKTAGPRTVRLRV